MTVSQEHVLEGHDPNPNPTHISSDNSSIHDEKSSSRDEEPSGSTSKDSKDSEPPETMAKRCHIVCIIQQKPRSLEDNNLIIEEAEKKLFFATDVHSTSENKQSRKLVCFTNRNTAWKESQRLISKYSIDPWKLCILKKPLAWILRFMGNTGIDVEVIGVSKLRDIHPPKLYFPAKKTPSNEIRMLLEVAYMYSKKYF
jgi:hypothetical protein